MRYSVTGVALPRDNGHARGLILTTLKELAPKPFEFTTGGAFGVDTIAAEMASSLYDAGLWPSCLLRLNCPADEPYNVQTRRLVHEVRPIAGSYMDRNDALVADCDVLLAFPATPREVLRSGTWATIRRARKAGKEIRFFPLDGRSKPFVEPAR